MNMAAVNSLVPSPSGDDLEVYRLSVKIHGILSGGLSSLSGRDWVAEKGRVNKCSLGGLAQPNPAPQSWASQICIYIAA